MNIYLIIVLTIVSNVVFGYTFKLAVTKYGVAPSHYAIISSMIAAFVALGYCVCVANIRFQWSGLSVVVVSGIATGVFNLCLGAFLKSAELSRVYPICSIGTLLLVSFGGIMFLRESLY